MSSYNLNQIYSEFIYNHAHVYKDNRVRLMRFNPLPKPIVKTDKTEKPK